MGIRCGSMTLLAPAAQGVERPLRWRERAREIGPLLNSAAARDEAARELGSDVVDAIDRAGLFGIMVPEELGGAEALPDEVIDCISELSYWDGSAGWYSHAVMTGGAVAGAYLGPRAVEAIFPEGRFLRAAGQAAPTGTAERVDDGYRISGRFSFGSGTAHAEWIVGGYRLCENGQPVLDRDGVPVMLIGMTSRNCVRFHGNWDVLGLRGTGSYDFEVLDHVRHEDFFFDSAAPVLLRGGPLYKMGFMAVPCISHASFALGVGHRLLDEWRAFAMSKPRGEGLACDLQTFQRDYASATAELHGAEAYVPSRCSSKQRRPTPSLSPCDLRGSSARVTRSPPQSALRTPRSLPARRARLETGTQSNAVFAILWRVRHTCLIVSRP
jgi:indole-3-acetate monooxygenase